MRTLRLLCIACVIAIAMTAIVMAADESTLPAIGGDVGYIIIDSSPSGAQASLDGQSLGSTPATGTVYVTAPPGHTVSVTMNGFQPYSEYIPDNPPAGGSITVEAVLVPIPVTLPVTPQPGEQKGYYSIDSNPGASSVVFDGTNYGTTPVVVTVSTTGTPGHTITVSRSGYQTWSQFYPGNPSDGQTISVYATLTPVIQAGSIYVSSNPSSATATLDNGYDQLITPGSFNSVSSGYHNIRVTRSGYQAYTTDVLVNSGVQSNVYAALTPIQQSGSISVSSVPRGAGLYVDGVYQGETNQVVGGMAVGTHTVTLKEAGYQTWTSTVGVNPGQVTSSYGYSYSGFESDNRGPPGQFISHWCCRIPEWQLPGSDLTGKSPGCHRACTRHLHRRPEKIRYQDYTTTTRIVAGTTAQVTATLTPASQQPTTANVQIISDPSGADVYLNNVYKGITPLSFQNVPPGTGTVTISLAGYNTYATTVTLTAGQDYQVNAALTPSAVPPAGGISQPSSLSAASL